MSTTHVDSPVARAKKLIELYERGIIGRRMVVCEITVLLTPENVEEVMGALTAQVCSLFSDWIPSLPDDNDRRVVLWPLPPGVTPALKKWLRDYELNGQSDNG